VLQRQVRELQQEADHLPALAARVARLGAASQQAQDLRQELALLQEQEQEVAQLRHSVEELRPKVANLPELHAEWRQASSLQKACRACIACIA
jgi:phage shock protein A